MLDIACKVCGDKSSGKHYGIFSCDGECWRLVGQDNDSMAFKTLIFVCFIQKRLLGILQKEYPQEQTLYVQGPK